MERIKKLLIEKKIKPTYIRLQVLEYIYDCQQHPSADAIFKVLEKEIPTISRTSVYNTLSLLETKGLISTHYISGATGRYDCNKGPHFHFICDECKIILDLEIDCKLLEESAVQGHTVRESFGYFKGLCRTCGEKAAAKQISTLAPRKVGDKNINIKEK